jgi:ppGpp synthetase/RelA/SpoT-type nucleotidyltranferase
LPKNKRPEDKPFLIPEKYLDSLWLHKPEIIEHFIRMHPDYEALSSEVAYILRKRLEAKEIQFASVIHRAKTLESFLEKVRRKTYDNPFVEMTDLAGARVVCLYKDDIGAIERIIFDEFEVLERKDKFIEMGVDRFGYVALHFIVRLGKKTSGARYDYLKDLVCEVQVRTILQDAWGLISRFLIYKHEDTIPDFVKRNINSIAGALELADDHLVEIKNKREQYISEATFKGAELSDILDRDVSLDNLVVYCHLKFPGSIIRENELNKILDILNLNHYPKLKDIDNLMKKMEGKLKSYFSTRQRMAENADNQLRVALGMGDREFRENMLWQTGEIKILDYLSDSEK